MLKKYKDKIQSFVIISLLLHLSFYVSMNIVSTPPKSKDKPLEFVILEVPKPQKMQIVEQNDKPLNDEIPENAKYKSKHNQRVAEETAAQKHGKFNNAVIAGMNTRGQKQAPKQKQAQNKPTQGTLPSLKQLKPKFSYTPNSTESHNSPAGQQATNNDHLKDVKPGIQTLLSTREFVYYAYYQRVREKIRQQWEPMIRDKVRSIFASGRTIASSRDRITQVIVVLNPEGKLIGVQIIGESGIRDLDNVAVEAFRAAEPFPNPPDGIVEKDGKIRIRWDFVLEAFVPPKEQQRQAARRVGP